MFRFHVGLENEDHSWVGNPIKKKKKRKKKVIDFTIYDSSNIGSYF